MTQPIAINAKLIDSLAQIILSLTESERQILAHKIQHPSLSGEELELRWKNLQREIALGAEQLKNGDYTEYDDSSLSYLLENIKQRGRERLQSEQD